ncbi:hypothetical protein B5F11_07925 [Anaerotruncus colihominis]|uniref:Uncharacterized protein n=2 Tax=Anaerotruncus colihominis TaxID=169435 RepID=B0P937_9FIRM|nr:hypothetical protein ANACOL_01283 [Anaerotruncus colihominis DSM 17241]OUP69565.1 hypothetical protein B5F11_07925 [Anaerotruncus colihominis]
MANFIMPRCGHDKINARHLFYPHMAGAIIFPFMVKAICFCQNGGDTHRLCSALTEMQNRSVWSLSSG